MDSGYDTIDGICINPIVHDHPHLPPGYQSDLDGIFLFHAGDELLGGHGNLVGKFEKYHVGQGDLRVDSAYRGLQGRVRLLSPAPGGRHWHDHPSAGRSSFPARQSQRLPEFQPGAFHLPAICGPCGPEDEIIFTCQQAAYWSTQAFAQADHDAVRVTGKRLNGLIQRSRSVKQAGPVEMEFQIVTVDKTADFGEISGGNGHTTAIVMGIFEEDRPGVWKMHVFRAYRASISSRAIVPSERLGNV